MRSFETATPAVFGACFDPQIQALAVRAGQICAVFMAADLGVAVRGVLADPRVPVYSVRNRVWGFVVARPRQTDDVARWRIELFASGVTVAWPGTIIALPTSGNSLRQWVNGPEDTVLPAFEAVVQGVITVTSAVQHPPDQLPGGSERGRERVPVTPRPVHESGPTEYSCRAGTGHTG